MGLAFIKPLKCHVCRKDADGTISEEIINVCRPVAYIILKAFAFDNRRKDKDVYDLIYVLENYKSGVDSVIAEILPDDVQSDSFSKALECLSRHFQSINHIEPRSYSNFMGGQDLNFSAQAYAVVQEFLRKVKKQMKKIEADLDVSFE